MPRSPSLTTTLLAAALAACGGEGHGTARAGEGAGSGGAVYTSEVEQVSRWIRESGGQVDSAGLEAAPNPHGEGVIVRSRSADTASGGEHAEWAVVDSQVVPLNPASRRATPALPPEDDTRTRERIGIPRAGEQAAPPRSAPRAEAPPPAPAAPRPAQEPRPRPRVPAPDTTAPVPFPRPAPEEGGPPDTLHVPSAPADTVRVPPPSRPVRDTLRIPTGAGPETGTLPTP